MGKDVACTDRLVVLLNSPRFKKRFHKAFVQMPDTLAGLCTDFLVLYTSANRHADVCVAYFWMESGQRWYYGACESDVATLSPAHICQTSALTDVSHLQR